MNSKRKLHRSTLTSRERKHHTKNPKLMLLPYGKNCFPLKKMWFFSGPCIFNEAVSSRQISLCMLFTKAT